MDEHPCADVPTAELAMGLLDGAERAEALDHVAGCSRCRDEAAAYSNLADGLASLTPEVEPPVGFDRGVLARLQPRPLHSRRPTLIAISVAAVLAVAIGVGAATAAIASRAGHTRPAPVAARLTDRTGHLVGDVVIDEDRSPGISASVRGLATPGPVRCEVRYDDGQEVDAGTFALHQGDGSWYAPLRDVDQITAVQLLDPGGRVVATGQLP